MATVLICADQHQARERLGRVMSRAGIGRIEVSSHEELIARYAHTQIDVVFVVMHGAAQESVDTVRRLRSAHPRANAIVFGGTHDHASVAAAVAAGAGGFLRWDSTEPEVAAALTHAMTSPAMMSSQQSRRPEMPSLTERELQVLRGMSQGKSNNQIGRELYLSEDTIKTHARRLFRKMDVNDRAEAVAQGFRHKLLV